MPLKPHLMAPLACLVHLTFLKRISSPPQKLYEFLLSPQHLDFMPIRSLILKYVFRKIFPPNPKCIESTGDPLTTVFGFAQ